MTETVKLEGYVDKIFHATNDFYIARLAGVRWLGEPSDDWGEDDAFGDLPSSITIKGIIPGIKVDRELKVTGHTIIHKLYGRQVDVKSFAFLDQTATDKKNTQALEFLAGLKSAKPGDIKTIFSAYGARTHKVLTSNPYRLITDLPSLNERGFSIAEEIAQNLGLSESDPRRHDAAVLGSLSNAVKNEGHVCLRRQNLIALTASDHDLDDYTFTTQAIDRLLNEDDSANLPKWVRYKHQLVAEHIGGAEQIYPSRLWLAEVESANDLSRLLAAPVAPVHITPAELEIDFPDHSDPTAERLSLSAEQRQAVFTAFQHKIVVLTGGPGVGKTTIIKAIVNLAYHRRLEVTLCAPTGRAAQRMQETSGCSAATIHRTLAFNPGLNKFKFNRDLPLTTDLVICDESSMVDIETFQVLLAAIPDHARMIFVGDVDQLPPVDPGAPFRDLIESGQVPVVRLTKIFRQKESSLIIRGAHQILRREVPTFAADVSGDLHNFTYSSIDRAIAKIVDLVTVKLPKTYGFRPEDIQVLAPTHKGPYGVPMINKALQHAIHKKNTNFEGKSFLPGDRVMQLKNDYTLDVFNGDVGYVTRMTSKGLTVAFPNKKVTYEREHLTNLALGYAASVHKAQGTEFPCVVVLANPSSKHKDFFSRNLLYTAITRGKQVAVVVSSNDKSRLKQIVETDSKPRNGFLMARVRRDPPCQ